MVAAASGESSDAELTIYRTKVPTGVAIDGADWSGTKEEYNGAYGIDLDYASGSGAKSLEGSHEKALQP